VALEDDACCSSMVGRVRGVEEEGEPNWNSAGWQDVHL